MSWLTRLICGISLALAILMTCGLDDSDAAEKKTASRPAEPNVLPAVKLDAVALSARIDVAIQQCLDAEHRKCGRRHLGTLQSNGVLRPDENQRRRGDHRSGVRTAGTRPAIGG